MGEMILTGVGSINNVAQEESIIRSSECETGDGKRGNGRTVQVVYGERVGLQ